MNESGVGFGTSGARGLADKMTDRVCYAYTLGFLQHLHEANLIQKSDSVFIAGDLRPSTPRIITACIEAIKDFGGEVVFAGFIPTPAVALAGLNAHCASIMVTGSHIPDDRNGIKFYKPAGEIMKSDEAGIKAQSVDLPESKFSSNGNFLQAHDLPSIDARPEQLYLDRFLGFFPEQL